MKKLMMSFAVAGLLVASATAMATTNNAAETLFQDKAATKETPVFSTPEANKAVSEFKTLMDEYGPFLAKNDSTKTMEFGQKIQQWSVGVQEWMAKLTPEEQQKIGSYLDEYSRKYMPAEPAAPPTPSAPAKITD